MQNSQNRSEGAIKSAAHTQAQAASLRVPAVPTYRRFHTALSLAVLECIARRECWAVSGGGVGALLLCVLGR